MRKETINFQIVLFLRDKFKDHFESLSLHIKEKIGDSDNTQILPIPSDAPSEIPRLILNYKDFFLNISTDRISLVANNYSSIKVIIPKLLSLFIEEKEFVINRIGFIRNDFIETTLESITELIKEDKFPKEKLKEISIRINNELDILNFSCNNIESLQFSRVIKTDNTGTIERDGILAQRDLNTVAEKDYKIDYGAASKLINEFQVKASTYSLLGG